MEADGSCQMQRWLIPIKYFTAAREHLHSSQKEGANMLTVQGVNPVTYGFIHTYALEWTWRPSAYDAQQLFTVHTYPLDELHLISPAVTTAQHLRPPSSLNKYTIRAHSATKVRRFANIGAALCGIGRGIKTLVGLQPVISTAALSMCCFLQQRVELWTGWTAFTGSPSLRNR